MAKYRTRAKRVSGTGIEPVGTAAQPPDGFEASGMAKYRTRAKRVGGTGIEPVTSSV